MLLSPEFASREEVLVTIDHLKSPCPPDLARRTPSPVPVPPHQVREDQQERMNYVPPGAGGGGGGGGGGVTVKEGGPGGGRILSSSSSPSSSPSPKISSSVALQGSRACFRLSLLVLPLE